MLVLKPKSEVTGIENYVTHNGRYRHAMIFFTHTHIHHSRVSAFQMNPKPEMSFFIAGDFEFYNIKDKYYDTEAIQVRRRPYRNQFYLLCSREPKFLLAELPRQDPPGPHARDGGFVRDCWHDGFIAHAGFVCPQRAIHRMLPPQ